MEFVDKKINEKYSKKLPKILKKFQVKAKFL